MLIDLTDQEVAALVEVLMSSTGAPWRVTHPLIMKIGHQQQQAAQVRSSMERDSARTGKGNSHGTADFDQERRAAGDVGSTGRDTFTPRPAD